MPLTPSSATPEREARPRRRLIAGLAAAAAAMILASPAGPAAAFGRTEPRGAPAPGDPAPDFTLPTLDGDKLRLVQLRGRPVVVNFWASWCNPCREEFPLLKKTLRRHRDDRLAVVGVTYRDIASDARAFARETRATWPLVQDEDGEVARAYGVRAIPQTFFLRPDGSVHARIFGPLSARELDREVRRIT